MKTNIAFVLPYKFLWRHKGQANRCPYALSHHKCPKSVVMTGGINLCCFTAADICQLYGGRVQSERSCPHSPATLGRHTWGFWGLILHTLGIPILGCARLDPASYGSTFLGFPICDFPGAPLWWSPGAGTANKLIGGSSPRTHSSAVFRAHLFPHLQRQTLEILSAFLCK